ncbi:MAG: class I SAM-dependent methyltransferase [Methylococcales bacterium]|nr:class I SAM-dependent methyltransferase [Methylococcales bacterium]
MTSKTLYRLEPDQDYRDDSLAKDVPLYDRKLVEDTAQHFEDCHQDYLFAWCNSDNLAFHYGYWDLDTPYNQHEALINKNQLLYDKAKIKPTDRVWDAGCGIGGSSIWMAKNFGNRATGVTISGKQVDYATKQAQKNNVANLADFIKTDFCNTPFDDETFDVVWAAESVCHTRYKGKFLKEAYRVLKKGGRLVYCDAFMMKREFNKQQWQTMMDFFNGWAVPNLCYCDEFEGLLKDNNFKDIELQYIHEQTIQSAEYMHKITKRLYPVQKISQWLGLRSKAQTANYYAGLAQYDMFHNRYAEYCVFTAIK